MPSTNHPHTISSFACLLAFFHSCFSLFASILIFILSLSLASVLQLFTWRVQVPHSYMQTNNRNQTEYRKCVNRGMVSDSLSLALSPVLMHTSFCSFICVYVSAYTRRLIAMPLILSALLHCDCGYYFPFNYTKKVKSNIQIKQQHTIGFLL